MSEIPPIFVLRWKINEFLNDVAKLRIKSEKFTPFGGFFYISNNRPLAYSQLASAKLAIFLKNTFFDESKFSFLWSSFYLMLHFYPCLISIICIRSMGIISAGILWYMIIHKHHGTPEYFLLAKVMLFST